MAEFIHQSASESQEPVVVTVLPVPASAGWQWYAEAWQLYLQQPATWSLLMLGYFALAIVFGLIPIAGNLVFALLGPVLIAGMYLGIHAQASGERIGFSVLWRAFSSVGGQVVLLTLLSFLIYLGSVLVLALFAALAQATNVIDWLQLFNQMQGEFEQLSRHPAPAMVFNVLRNLGLLILALLALLTPLMMLFFFRAAAGCPVAYRHPGVAQVVVRCLS